ncbi:response regulator transcription factor [Brevibacillus agri]|nr:response regulator transcription factor [Brevibacillus agri]QHZ58324.1 response regulator transcription factor [Brevibacillus sp. NSP2.1]
MTTRILIIEDETTIAQLERDYFELNGFQVDLCHNGSEGLQLALRDGSAAGLANPGPS